jgi:hypothetical protein
VKESLKNAIHQQRIELAGLLSSPLAMLAEKCAWVWGKRE